MPDHTRQEQIDFIRNPDNWPQWPALPIKNREMKEEGSTAPRTAYLWGDPNEADPVKVYDGNIFSISKDDPILAEYENVEAMVDAGWEVD